MADKENLNNTIATDIVVTKYKMAGNIVNRKCVCICMWCGNRHIMYHILTRVNILLYNTSILY